MPTLKSVIKEIEINEDREPVYQGQKLKYYSKEIQRLKNHGAGIIKSILSCYSERYCNLYSQTTTDNPISDGDTVIFDVCRVLNTTAWLQLNDSNKFFQFSSLESTAFLKHSSSLPVFESVTRESLQSGYADIICYAHRYFAVDKIKPMNLWSKICLGNKEKESWHYIILLFDLCLCTPFSNATLERYFSHLKVVKTEIRSRLSSESLNSVMRIHMKELSLTGFKENYSSDCVNYWYNSRSRRLNQQKRKKYEDRKATKKRRPNFKISDLESDYTTTVGSSDEED